MALEGTLSKWTNVMKGWQNRWFVLEAETSLLSYYTVSFCCAFVNGQQPDKKSSTSDRQVTIKIMGEAKTWKRRTLATIHAANCVGTADSSCQAFDICFGACDFD